MNFKLFFCILHRFFIFWPENSHYIFYLLYDLLYSINYVYASFSYTNFAFVILKVSTYFLIYSDFSTSFQKYTYLLYYSCLYLTPIICYRFFLLLIKSLWAFYCYFYRNNTLFYIVLCYKSILLRSFLFNYNSWPIPMNYLFKRGNYIYFCIVFSFS